MPPKSTRQATRRLHSDHDISGDIITMIVPNWLILVSSLASIAGFGLSLAVLWYAKGARALVESVRDRLTRRFRLQEIRVSLAASNKRLSRNLSSSKLSSAMTICRLFEADLSSLRKCGSEEMIFPIDSTLKSIRTLSLAREEERMGHLNSVRDSIERIIRLAEHFESDLAWSKPDE